MRSAIISSILSLTFATFTNAACSGAYAQCGGLNFSGDNCCTSGYECKFINQWYSSCQPSTATANAVTTTTVTAPTSGASSNAAASTSSYPRGTGIQLVYNCKNKNHWAMTFDDGPTEYADIILDLLKKYNIKATFFVVGNLYMKSENPEWTRIIKRMDAEGHIIGNHTYNHTTLTGLTAEEITNEMKLLEEKIYNAIGKKPLFMRFPTGAGGRDQTVMSTLESLGYNASVLWNVDTVDYANGGDAEYAVSVIDKQSSTGSSLVTLNHLQYGGATAEGIIQLATAEIERILSLGYTPVTMEECIGIRAYE